MKTLINRKNPQIRITAPEIEKITSLGYTNYKIAREGMFPLLFNPKDWALVKEEPEVDLEKELEAFLCNYEEDGDAISYDIAHHFYELGRKGGK